MPGAQAIIIGKKDAAAGGLVERFGGKTPIIDLVRVNPVKRSDGSYDGICW